MSDQLHDHPTHSVALCSGPEQAGDSPATRWVILYSRRRRMQAQLRHSHRRLTGDTVTGHEASG